MSQNLQNNIFREVGLVFGPLTSLDSAHRVTALFKKLGYELPGSNNFSNFPGLASRVEGLIEVLIEFDKANDEDKAEVLVNLVAEIINLMEEVIALEQDVSNAAASVPGFVANAPLDQLPLRLLDYLIISYTATHRKPLNAVFNILGVFEEEELTQDPGIFQSAVSLKKIFWDRLPKLISDPVGLFDEVYQWQTNFDSDKFFPKVDGILRAFLLPGGLYQQSQSLKNAIGNTSNNLKELRFPILQHAVYPSTYNQFGINVTSVEAHSSKKAGFAVVPYVHGAAEFDFSLSEKWEILFEANSFVDSGLGVIIRPGETEFLTDIFNAPIDSGNLNASLSLQPKEDVEEIILFGGAKGTRLAIEDPRISIFIKNEGENKDAGAEVELGAIRLVIAGDEGDGFLTTLLGDGGINAESQITVGYSAAKDFYFTGSGSLELQLATHIDLGPIEIQGLIIALKIKDGDFNVEGGATFKANLGPLAAVVENMGLVTTLSFPKDGGNLGPANLALDFKPPNGVGLSIDAGVVKGGGFIKSYPEKGEYSGALELTFSEIISLKAIGIINTKMPDGSDGFSLLVIISAEFGSGIQLGFGFTLLGVGGLLGLNRTMKLDALATGIRTGAVNGIMFPTNIIENAPRIISDLQDFFPVHQDRFLIGPMAKLGWGTPTLISISLGIIIEIPGNIAILGILKIVLPTEEASLIKLQVNFIGAIEFDKERLWFFASMYDSRVLFYTLEGEMGMLVGWGAKANFVSSVGGFHPAFKPPTLPFPNPVRISLSILNESWGKIRVMAYFAVTSNTAQFGAKAELYFGFSELKIEGHIGFDALFQFSPFYMIIQLSASLSVKVFGIGLFSVRVKMSLEGPAPWYAHGTGSISLLFFDIDVDFDFTWGEEKDTTLPPISIMPLLIEEFEKQENWKALVPVNNNLLVSLRKIDSVAELVLHPVGTLQVIQRAIPLELTLDKMGSQKPDDANFFSLEPEGSELSKIKTLDEDFAIAQFKELKDAEKLSSPSFQTIQGGIELSISGEQLKTGKTVKRHVRYELITVDTNYKRGRKAFFKFLKSLFSVFLRGNTVSRAEISYQTNRNLQPFDSKINIQEPGFSVAKISNNTVFDAESHFSSQAQAKEYMQAQLLVHPELEDELHVLPNNEINPAA